MASVCLLLLLACKSTTRTLRSDVDAKSVDHILLFDPSAYIISISKGDKVVFSPGISEKAAKQVRGVVKDYLETFYERTYHKLSPIALYL